MKALIKYILLTIVLTAGINVLAQQGTTPVGVDVIIVTFNNPPSSLNVFEAPLKYNKTFALSMQIDDADLSLYTNGYPVFHGGVVDGESYPGLFYSDGCGNMHEFKMSAVVYCFGNSGNNGPDVHIDNSSGQLSWQQMDTIYGQGWGIYNHGVNSDASSNTDFVDYSINRGRSYIRRSLFETTEGGVITNIFVNPNGNPYYTQPSFNLGNISALNQNVQFPLGNNGGNVNDSLIDWTQPQSLYRLIAEDLNVPDFVDGLADSSNYGKNYWSPIFTHSLVNNYLFDDFTSDFNYIANTYGADGLDNILMTTDEEIQDYLIVRDAVSMHYVVDGSTVYISYDGEAPDDLRFYSSSIVIEADAAISDITIYGNDDHTYTGIGQTDGLINLNWDGKVIIPDTVLADSMVNIAVASGTQYDAWVAMDYVITLENGSHKDSLRQVLCDIPGTVYNDGFCDCEIDLQPDTTTIKYGDCIDLEGAVGDYTWEWLIGDSLIATTQDIYECPEDTTLFRHVATNIYGCPAEDNILVNIDFLNFSLGPDDTICIGTCDTLHGPPNMSMYWWYENGEEFSNDSVVIVCPELTTDFSLTVEDTIGSTASDTITIFTLDVPIMEFDADTIRSCDGIDFDPGLLVVGEFDSLNWVFNNIDTVTYTEEFILVEPDTSGTLFVTAFGVNGCNSIDSVYLSVFPWPDIIVTNDTSLCKGDSIDLKVTGGTIFRWIAGTDTISMDSVVTVVPDSTTAYIAETAFADSLCFAMDTVIVSILSPAETAIEYDTNVVCQYSEIVLTATGADTYLWTPGDDTTAQYSFIITDTTKVWLTGTSVDGCVHTDSVEMAIIEAPVVSFSGLLQAYCENDDAQVLVGVPSGGSFYSDGIVGDEFYPSLAGTGMHEVVYGLIDTTGCWGYDTLITTVYANGGEIDLGSDFDLLPDSSKLLDAGAGFNSYIWTTGETTQEITVTNDGVHFGTYEYAVMGLINGCSTRGSVMVTFSNPDGISENLFKGLRIYPNPANGSFNIEFESNDNSFAVDVFSVQGYKVYSRNNIGCNDNCHVTIELPQLQAGIYFIEIRTANGVVTSRIVIN